MLKLYIGNKNYSSWSMRPWVLLKQVDIPFEEILIRFDSFEPDSRFKQTLNPLTPTGKVPLLVDTRNGNGLSIWDTLAIAEYLAEQYPEKMLWPQAKALRAHARSICAEMHSGFNALREYCPMNIEASLPEIGQRIWREQAAVRTEMERIIAMWSELLTRHGGPLLFGNFSIADAYFAPVCMRIKTYALPVPARILTYINKVSELPGVLAWITQALAEKDFRKFEEPYR
jgi:glutathione S-transferase